MIYPAQLNVFGSGLSPLISYKYDRATSSRKKHYNIYDHLGTLAQTYKQIGLGAIPTSMQTHNPFGSERWTNKNLTTKESTLLNWVGKEKDNESKLGDHGVRKYEYETGRFISIDPLWGNYYGWTPYQYSMNSPVMLVDVGGEKVQALNQGARDAIVGSVEAQYEQFVRFDENGFVDAKFLKENLPSDIDVNSNAHTLMRLAENSRTATVSVQKEFWYLEKGGNFNLRRYFEKGDPYEKDITLIEKGGYTVLPYGLDADADNKYSLDGSKTNIYLNPNNSEKNAAKSAAHELFLHYRFFLLMIPSNHETSDRPDWYKKYENQSGE